MRFYRLIKSNLNEYLDIIRTQTRAGITPLFHQTVKNLEKIKFLKLSNKEVIKILNLILFTILKNDVYANDNKVFAEQFQILYKVNFISPKDIKSTKLLLNCINGIYKAFDPEFFLELFTEDVDEVFKTVEHTSTSCTRSTMNTALINRFTCRNRTMRNTLILIF